VMEELLEILLAKQLTGYFQQAGGKIDDAGTPLVQQDES